MSRIANIDHNIATTLLGQWFGRRREVADEAATPPLARLMPDISPVLCDPAEDGPNTKCSLLIRHEVTRCSRIMLRFASQIRSSPMYVPDSCPICGFSAIKATLEEFTLTVNHGSNVGGVMAFRCSNSHIFFVRIGDLHLLADSVSKNGQGRTA